MRNRSVVLALVVLLTLVVRATNHHEEAVIHDTCKKTHMYGHCVQAIHSYELFEFTDHTTPSKIASIIVYVTGVQQVSDTLKHIDDLILSSRGESLYYKDALKACKQKYQRIYDSDYFTAWVNMANGKYDVSESAMWSARERANSCERGFDRAGKHPVTQLNDKLRMLSLIAAEVLRSLK